MKIKSNKLKYAAVVLLLGVAIYFAAPVLNQVAGAYNRKFYRDMLHEKQLARISTYYVSSNGNNKDDGRSPATAWRTIDKINDLKLNPGDSVLFEAEKVFTGNLQFDRYDLGTSEKPITICSYGKGRAVINAGNETGIQITNAQGFHITNLNIQGSGASLNDGSGISVTNNLYGNIKLDHIQVDSTNATGFGYYGIAINGGKNKSGFRNVSISSCNVFANGDAGLYIKGEYDYKSLTYAHKNVSIKNVKAYDNPGRPKSKQNTGSGIVLSDTEDGLIEGCTAYNNGALCHSEIGGPVGIWAWDSKNVVIQKNESFNNKTGSTKDGGGFDLDGGMVNSILQNNYSHDNDGPGLFLAQFSYARQHTGNIVRYNISYNDGRKNRYAGIEVWGRCENASIYNNTVLVAAAPQCEPSAFTIRPNDDMGLNNRESPGNIFVTNNIFLSEGKMELVRGIDPLPTIRLANNNYYNLNSKMSIRWKDKEYPSFTEWRKATSQEKRDNALVGYNVNPLLVAVDTNFRTNAVKKLDIMAFQLSPNSPMIDAGVNVLQLLNLNKGISRDINNVTVPQNAAFDLGACEYAADLSSLNQPVK